MAKTSFTSVNEYIASQPQAVQRVVTRVRRIIRKAMPGAEWDTAAMLLKRGIVSPLPETTAGGD